MTTPLPTLDISPLRADELPAMLRIQAQCYTAIVPESAAALEAKRRAAPATCLAARRAGVLIGYLLSLPLRWPALPPLDCAEHPPQPNADTLYLHDLALLPAARGSGAGARLVRLALARGAGQGLGQAALVAIQGSVPYWRRHGFAVSAVPDAATAAHLRSYGADARLMRRPLPAPGAAT